MTSDGWRAVGDSLTVRHELATAVVDLWIGVHIDAVRAAMPRQITIEARNTDRALPYIYGELFEDTLHTYVAISKWNGTTYSAVMKTDLPFTIHPGDFTLHLDAGATAGHADIGWPDLPYSTSGLTTVAGTHPDDGAHTGVEIFSSNLDFELTYFAAISTN